MTDMPLDVNRHREAAPGIIGSDAQPVNAQASRSLYAARTPIYPKLARGTFRRVKWAVMVVALGIYYLLPWLRWDRGAGVPDQAFLLDFAHQKLYIFGLTIWAQELYFITGLLILSALALFVVTAVAGRVWCGYACPQTVWTDLMIAVESFFQGDRNARMKLDKAPWTFDKIWRKSATHFTWLVISVATGGALVFYFRDAPTLFMEFVNFEAPAIAYIFLGIFTATTYTLGGLAREQVCTYMCPWPRIQGAMFDKDSLLVTYRAYRGEPRGPHKKGDPWEGRGDCIDCNLCVAVCPMGIDIRHGPQLECIQCALCIDACDEVMEKIGRPKKLIAYDTFRNLDAASHGERAPLRIVRPRTVMYAGLIAFVGLVMLAALAGKTVLDVNVIADRNPLFVQLSDGSIRNSYTVRVLNKRDEPRNFELRKEGLDGAALSALSAAVEAAQFTVPANGLQTLKVFVTLNERESAKLAGTAPLTFVVRDLSDNTETRRTTNFQGPDR
jgi:cytochrome c oxidase accessory protein FixG